MTNPDVDNESATVDWLMRSGKAYYAAGEAQQSKAAYERAVQLDPGQAEAWYHLGLLHYAVSKDLEEAERCFRRSVALGHRVDLANTYLRKIEATRPPATPPPPAAATAPTSPPPAARGSRSQIDFSERYGVYEVLSLSDDPLVRQPLAMMDALRISSRPRLQAFSQRYITGLAVGVLIAYVIAQLSQTVRYASDAHVRRTASPVEVLGFAVFLVALAWLWTTLDVLSTRYVLDKGRLQQTSGVLTRTTISLELFRVTNVGLERDVLQRLTGDGAIAFTTHDQKVLVVVGLASGERLEAVYYQLLDLIFALRANQYVRGLIA